MRFLQFFNKKNGFTIVELAIVIAIAGTLSAVAYTVYTNDVNTKTEQVNWERIQSQAFSTSDDLVRDIRLAGSKIDFQSKQPIFIHAGPYELTFNSDLYMDRESIDPDLSGATIPPNPAIRSGAIPYSPEKKYIDAKAETVRWSLDSDNNGILEAFDLISSANPKYNPNLYKLYRQVFGSNGLDNGGKLELFGNGIRGPHAYPDGTYPPPLFSYWIKEDRNNSGVIEIGSGEMDVNGNGKADEYLWGDDGSNMPGTENNGTLEQGELKALYFGNNIGNHKRPKTLNMNQERVTTLNADSRLTGGQILPTLQSELANISKIEVNVIIETQKDFPDYLESPHGDKYKYKEVAIKVMAKPRVHKVNKAKLANSPTLIIVSNSPVIFCPYTYKPKITAIAKDLKGYPVEGLKINFVTTMGSLSSTGKKTTSKTTNKKGEAIISFYPDKTEKGTVEITASAIMLHNTLSSKVNIETQKGSPANIEAKAFPETIPADGISTSTITAVVKDSCGNKLDNFIVVNMSTTQGTLNADKKETKNGEINTKITAGLLPTKALINFGIKDTKVKGHLNVDFVDCRLILNTEKSAIPGDGLSTTTLKTKLIDLAGNPVSNTQINFSITKGSLLPAYATTNSEGTIIPQPVITSTTLPEKAIINGKVLGGKCLNTKSATQIAFHGCNIHLNTSKPRIGINDSSDITVTLTNSKTGTPISDTLVTFSDNLLLGDFNPAFATTDINGQIKTIFSSGSSPGYSQINAESECGTGSTTIQVELCDHTITAAEPVTNSNGQLSSVIVIKLQDSITHNAKPNIPVKFSTDLGSFVNKINTAITDETGKATVTIQSDYKSGTATVTASTQCGLGIVKTTFKNTSTVKKN